MAKRGVSIKQEKSLEPLEVEMPQQDEVADFDEGLFEGLDSMED